MFYGMFKAFKWLTSTSIAGIIISSSADPPNWSAVRRRYIKCSRGPFITFFIDSRDTEIVACGIRQTCYRITGIMRCRFCRCCAYIICSSNSKSTGVLIYFICRISLSNSIPSKRHRTASTHSSEVRYCSRIRRS